MILYHVSKEIVEFPEIRKSKFTKDFSWGFYCTNNYDQAVRWANRGEGTPTINVYQYTPNNRLNILSFEKMTDEWLDFIATCRQGGIHDYDIVEGSMADDTIWNFVNDFLSGLISRKVFWEYAKFKHPTHQISFHTIQALACLKYERSETIHERSDT